MKTNHSIKYVAAALLLSVWACSHSQYASNYTYSDSVTSSVKKKLSTGVHLIFSERSIENELISFIEDKSKAIDKLAWFNFRDLKFEPASAKLATNSLDFLRK